MRFLSFIALVTLLFSSCYKDVSSSEVIEIIVESPKDAFDTGLIGQVFTDEGLALSDYDLVINGSTYAVQGDFFSYRLSGITEKGQLVEVIKNNKFIGLDYFYPLGNDINRIEIQSQDDFNEILYNPGATTLDSESSFAIEYNEGFGPVSNDIVIRSKVIDDNKTIRQFANSAYLKNGDLVVLEPVKAILVSLSSNGQRVFPSTNTVVKISSISNHGKTVFGYDREFNYWRELGELGESEIVTSVLDHYVIADYEVGVYNEGLISQDMKPISFAAGTHEIGVRSIDFISSEKGRWAYVLPGATELKTTIYNPCDEVVAQNSTETSSSENRNLELVIADNISSVVLEGDIIDCDADLAEVPSIVISENGSQSVYIFSESEINHKVLTCGNDIQLAAVNLEEGSEGPLMDWNTNETSSLNFLTNCTDNQDGYSYIKIRDEKKPYPSFAYDIVNGSTILTSSDNTVRITFAGDMKGPYEEKDVKVYINDPEFGKDGYSISCEESTIGCGFTSFNVSHFDEQGSGWLRMTFEGNLWMQTLNTSTVGDFEVEGVILIKT